MTRFHVLDFYTETPFITYAAFLLSVLGCFSNICLNKLGELLISFLFWKVKLNKKKNLQTLFFPEDIFFFKIIIHLEKNIFVVVSQMALKYRIAQSSVDILSVAT